jgi:hypothetical protein
MTVNSQLSEMRKICMLSNVINFTLNTTVDTLSLRKFL